MDWQVLRGLMPLLPAAVQNVAARVRQGSKIWQGRPKPTCQLTRPAPANMYKVLQRPGNLLGAPRGVPGGSSNPVGFSQGCHTLVATPVVTWQALLSRQMHFPW